MEVTKMARRRRMKRSLGGLGANVARHANEVMLAARDAQQSGSDARNEAINGSCEYALRELRDAIRSEGEMFAHHQYVEKMAIAKGGMRREKILARKAVNSAYDVFKRRCVVKR